MCVCVCVCVCVCRSKECYLVIYTYFDCSHFNNQVLFRYDMLRSVR